MSEGRRSETASDRGGRRAEEERAEGRRPRVLVVGAGVSGCACAARLGEKGADVLVVSSALDAVGLPGHGPELWWSEPASAGIPSAARACLEPASPWGPEALEGLIVALASLPAPLRAAWIDAALVTTSGEPVVLVDRRAVSIDTKRALEGLDGVALRQGHVTDVRLGEQGPGAADQGSEEGSLEIETIFGEVFAGDAVVIAVGLALGGHVEVGQCVMPGGRYGELPADELLDRLRGIGASFADVSHDVGSRFSRHDSGIQALMELGDALDAGVGNLAAGETGRREVVRLQEWIGARIASLAEGSARLSELVGDRGGFLVARAAEWPPAPHQEEEFRPRWMAVGREEGRGGDVTADGVDLDSDGPCDHRGWSLVPDGAATGEYYLSGARAVGQRFGGETRPGHRIFAQSASDVDVEGRPLGLDPVLRDRLRIIGRAAGEATYVGSMLSGLRVADALWASLSRERPGDEGV